MRGSRARFVAWSVAALVGASVAWAGQVNLLSLGEGALPVVEAPGYGGWPAVQLIDEPADTGWASASGQAAGPHLFVFELPAIATLDRFELDTASIDGDGRGAKLAVVEVSTSSKESGFTEVLRAELADRADGQRFAAARRLPARWVRLTLRGNHGDAEWSELMGFRAFGEPPAAAAPAEISGTYDSDYSLFHVRQQGSALAGCYEYNDGLLNGTIEGRVMKLTWREGTSTGPAILVFAPDGASFRGHWWHGSDKDSAPSGTWNGRRRSSAVGSCPHWSGSVGGELQKGLASTGRARLYGILFDSDSATLRPESRPVLDEVVRVLSAERDWKLVIEGHTDALASDAHNLELSQARASSVTAYLVSRGVESSRLRAMGLGEAQPVADNATELGRARNRRVELVRE